MPNCKDNGLDKLLVLGKTGTGKSTLCNILAGFTHDSDEFSVSPDPTSCTQTTKIGDYNFLGERHRRFTLIDTVGFDDPTKNHDSDIIAELVTTLKYNCDFINMILIAQNGNNPRFDGALLSMMKVFEGMFTKKIWKHVGIVFTKLPMDARSRARRGENDTLFAKKFIASMASTFNLGGTQDDIPYFFIDAKYYNNDGSEVEMFGSECSRLWKKLSYSDGLSTDEVTRVQTENELLNQRIEAERRAREVARRKAAAEQARAAEERRARARAEQEAREQEQRAEQERIQRREAAWRARQEQIAAEQAAARARREREARERASREAARERDRARRERERAREAEERRREAERDEECVIL